MMIIICYPVNLMYDPSTLFQLYTDLALLTLAK